MHIIGYLTSDKPTVPFGKISSTSVCDHKWIMQHGVAVSIRLTQYSLINVVIREQERAERFHQGHFSNDNNKWTTKVMDQDKMTTHETLANNLQTS